MKQSPTNFANLKVEDHGYARKRFLAAFFLVLVASAGWYFRPGKVLTAPSNGMQSDLLSSGTKAVLKNIKAPLEIRFYSLLDIANVAEADRAFAARVSKLLSAYEQKSGGKIKVVRHTAFSSAEASAAESDGIHAFNRDKGNACYFGIAVAQGDQKKSLPELSSDWEQALESDLSRAIAGVGNTASQGTATVVSPAAIAADQAVQSNPNLSNQSLEDGINILRAAALAEFGAATKEMQTKSAEMELRVNEAQNPADKEKAKEELQQFQAAQTDKLKAIATRLHDQIEALERLKSDTQSAASR